MSSSSTLESSNHSSPEGKACRMGNKPRKEPHIHRHSHTAASHLLAQALAGFQVSLSCGKNLEPGCKALAATSSRCVGRAAYSSELPRPEGSLPGNMCTWELQGGSAVLYSEVRNVNYWGWEAEMMSPPETPSAMLKLWGSSEQPCKQPSVCSRPKPRA